MGDGDVAGEALGHRASNGGVVSTVQATGGVLHQQACRADVLGHVGENPLQALVLRDWTAELLALGHVVERRLETRLGDAYRQRGDAHSALVQCAHHDVEATAFLAEQRVFGKFYVVEGQPADLGRALAHLVFFGPLADTRQAAVDNEDAHATLAGGGISARQNECQVRHRCVVDPQLRAVQAPAVGRTNGSGANVGNV
ncbi:hypothetical protein D3C80_1429900 [compost metagenome]